MQKGGHVISPRHASSKPARGHGLGSQCPGAVLRTDKGVVPQVLLARLALRSPSSTRVRITFGKDLLQDGPLLVCSSSRGSKKPPVPPRDHLRCETMVVTAWHVVD